MNTRDLTFPTPDGEPAMLPLEQPCSPEVAGADPGAPTRGPGQLEADLAGVVIDPGAIEYASWFRYIRAGAA